MNSILYLDRPAMNPVSFYLSHLISKWTVDTGKKIDKVITLTTLHRLAYLGSTLSRRRIAEDPAVNPETLLKLVQDKNPEVRLSAAEHPNMPFFALKRLVQDPCLDVRFGLAENPNLPIAILEVLAKDENPYIQDRASRSLNRRNAANCISY